MRQLAGLMLLYVADPRNKINGMSTKFSLGFWGVCYLVLSCIQVPRMGRNFYVS
jgi:hypothetical protein